MHQEIRQVQAFYNKAFTSVGAADTIRSTNCISILSILSIIVAIYIN